MPPPRSIFVDEIPGFMQAIRQEPEDNSLRLICADYLEEHGYDTYGSFIRYYASEQPQQQLTPSFLFMLNRLTNTEQQPMPLWEFLHQELHLDHTWLVTNYEDGGEAQHLRHAGTGFHRVLFLDRGFVRKVIAPLADLWALLAFDSHPLRAQPIEEFVVRDKAAYLSELQVMQTTVFQRVPTTPQEHLTSGLTFANVLPSQLFQAIKLTAGVKENAGGTLHVSPSTKASAAISVALRGMLVPDYGVKSKADTDEQRKLV